MVPEYSYPYHFIVTGASGNVGRRLIPLLASGGHRILAVGRDVPTLEACYAAIPAVDVASYDDLAGQQACDTLVHLAVRNNNQSGTLEDFTYVNVNFAIGICEEFNRMGGRRFINISSILSLDPDNVSPYAVSKNLARRRIADLVGDRLDDIHIGYFYDERYFGEKLALLKSLGVLGSSLFGLFKALKPTTSARSLADYIMGSACALPAPHILTDDVSQLGSYRSAMRAIDIMVALIVLIVLLPVFVVLWALIPLDSPGPAIFAQTRVGKRRAPFILYKFRTMKPDTVAAGTHEVSVSAVTGIGKFLRRTKLDELPQAINLLRGEMTLVGPRPSLPSQEELVNERANLGVFGIKPGITGYAQIRQIDMSRPQELARADYVFMKLQSLTLNLKIILLTAFGRGGGDRIASAEKLQDH